MNATTTQAQQAVLAYVYDASHGWLMVSLDSEHGNPDAAKYAGDFSYYDITGDNFAGVVFLEEDEDAAKYASDYDIDLLAVETIDISVASEWLRNLPRYNA